MKNLKRLMTGVALLGALVLMPSCEQEGEDLQITFPELDNVTGESAGEEQTLTFDAATAWSLNSSASWIKFNNGGAWNESITGPAGKQTVTYRIEGTGWDTEETSADITLKMGEESQVVVTVVRPAKEPEMSFFTYSNDGTFTPVDFDEETQTLHLGSSVRFGVLSSFDWTLEIPLWIAKGNATEYKASDEVEAIWFNPEYKAFEYCEKMEGEIKIASKDNPEINFTINVETAGSDELLNVSSDKDTFKFNCYGLYDLPDDRGVADSYSLTVISGAVPKGTSFTRNNCIAIEVVEDGENPTYKRIYSVYGEYDTEHQYPPVIPAWCAVSATEDPKTGKLWFERYTGTSTVAKYGYTIKTESNIGKDTPARKAAILVIPLKYFKEDGSCAGIELFNEDKTLKDEFKKCIKAHVVQDGSTIQNTLLFPAEAAQTGGTMRLMDPNNAEDKAYMDARIAEMTGDGFETYEGRIVYENMWELSYEHPSSSQFAQMGKIGGFADRDVETQKLGLDRADSPHNYPVGVAYRPKDFSWIDIDVDDYTCITMKPDSREENFEPLDGWIVIRPLVVVDAFLNDKKEWVYTYKEPESYQFIRCKIASNVTPAQ